MSSQSKKTVTITDNSTGKQVELPVLEGTDGPGTIDIRSLYKELGYFTFDPGFMSTASCDSKITFIDGGEGPTVLSRLPYRAIS